MVLPAVFNSRKRLSGHAQFNMGYQRDCGRYIFGTKRPKVGLFADKYRYSSCLRRASIHAMARVSFAGYVPALHHRLKPFALNQVK